MVNQPLVRSLIRLRREQLGMSARALSLKAGQSASYVHKLESGLIDPSFKGFAKLVKALELSPREIALIVALEAMYDD